MGLNAFDPFNPLFPHGSFSSGVLADNGGPTETVALRNDPANPAIDAADPADAPALDQRGTTRDATPDIGAFELDAPAATPSGDTLQFSELFDPAELGEGVESGRSMVADDAATLGVPADPAAVETLLTPAETV